MLVTWLYGEVRQLTAAIGSVLEMVAEAFAKSDITPQSGISWHAYKKNHLDDYY